MLAKPLLLGALAARSAMAQLPVAGAPGAGALQARMLDDLDEVPNCAPARDSVLSVYKQMPTPAAVLDDAELPRDVCAEPSFTGETARAWSSYTSAAVAVLASHTAEIASAFSACPDLLGRLPTVPACVAAATAAPAPASTAAGAGTTTGSGAGTTTGSKAPAEATGAASGPASTSSPDQNAAPRAGALVATLWAAAGLVCGAAAL